MAPDYRKDNPYQTLLCGALEAAGFQVAFPLGYRRVLPLFRLLRERRGASVLHLHWQDAYIRSRSAFGSTFYAVKLVADLACIKLWRYRIVWTVHNGLPHDTPLVGLHRGLQRAIAYLADAVIVHSDAAKEEVLPLLRVDSGKMCVIPHGTYREYYGKPVDKRLARAQLGLPESGRIYVQVGMLRPYKGTEELLAAWNAVCCDSGEAHLVIAGLPLSEEYRSTVAALAASSPRTIFRPGFIRDSDMCVYLSAADYLVLPFRRVLTSGSVLLAMSYGVPVIAPSVPVVVETLKGKVEWLYDPSTPGGLEDALRRTFGTTPLSVEYGGMSHDWSAIAASTGACYSERSSI